MRVALVRPLARHPSYDAEIQEPLGLELLTAVLRERGHAVLLEDALLFPRPEEELARGIAAFRPRVVGLSLMSDADVESAATLIERVARQSEDTVRFVLGGSLASTEPGRVAKHFPDRTLIVRHEGEGPLLGLLDAIERGAPYASVPSLVWQEDGRLNASPGRTWVENLDSLPRPARDSTRRVAERCGAINVQSSRGCSGRCAYCCMPGVPRPAGRGWRGRSPEAIADELEELNRDAGVEAFNFVDDDFLGPSRHSEQRAIALAAALCRRRLHIGFGAQFRPGSLGPRAIDALADAGLAWAFVGVETDDPETLRSWQRSPRIAVAWRAIGHLRRRGVEVSVGAILFHPGATLDGVWRFSRELADRGLLNYRTATSRLHLLPGAALYDTHRRAGQIPPGAAGPYTPPLRDAALERRFDGLVRSLSPLRPVWVHVASLLPGLVSRHRAGGPVAGRLATLRGIIDELDRRTRLVFAAWLRPGSPDPSGKPGELASRRAGCRRVALSACERLDDAGLLAHAAPLRHAILIEGER